MGDMSEWYNEHCDPFEDEPTVKCKYCKKEVVWEMTPAGWRLFDEGGSLHDCNDPFEIVRRLENDRPSIRRKT